MSDTEPPLDSIDDFDDTALRADVIIGPAPDIVPADLTGLLRPVRTVDGTVDDYQLRALNHATDPIAEYLARFAAWRRQWRPSYQLGPTANVAALIAYTTSEANVAGIPLPELAALNLAGDCCSGDRADQLRRETAVARSLVLDSEETGWALLDRVSGHQVRALAPLGRSLLLERAGAALVHADGDGLHLTFGTSTLDIHGWTLTGTVLQVHTLTGATEEVTGDAAHVLQQLVPAASHVRVRRVPLSTVWASAIVGLDEAFTAGVTYRMRLVRTAPVT